MLLIWILLALIILLGLLHLWIKQIYQYHRKRHQTTPANIGIKFQEIWFPTKNDHQLYGWWMPNHHKRTAINSTLILVHGWGRNVERMMPYIQELYPRGYNLLALDLRNHGSSDQDRYPTILAFAQDISAATDFVEGQIPAERRKIGVIGLSVGGASAIYAASIDNRIKAVVTVGSPAHPANVMRSELQKKHIPYFPLIWLFLKYIQFKIGVKFEKIAPVNNIQNIKGNVFLIHGNYDKVIPVEQGKRLRDAGNPGTTQFWAVPDKGHADCHHHPEFWKKLVSFLQASIPGTYP